MRKAILSCLIPAALVLGASGAECVVRYYILELPSLKSSVSDASLPGIAKPRRTGPMSGGSPEPDASVVYDMACGVSETGVIAGRSGATIVTWGLSGEEPKSRYKPPKEQVADVTATNGTGVMCGRIADIETGRTKAIVVDETGKLTDLGDIGGRHADARGINDSGAVIGSAFTKEGESKAFLWKPKGSMQALALLSGFTRSGAHDINTAGQIVGFCGPSAVIWEADGSVKELSMPKDHNRCVAYAVNSKGQVAGEATDAQNKTRAFFWDPQKGTAVQMESAPGYEESRAEDLNDKGHIVGWVRSSQNETRAAMWNTEGKLADLGQLSKDVDSQAFGINNAGFIVGVTKSRDGKTQHAVVWTPKNE